MQYKDYYQILGVSRDAMPADIKIAFRKLARKFHPDVSNENDAEAQMKALNEAITVLSDTEKRLAYDLLGQNYRAGEEFQPPADWDSHFGDLFSQLFGRMNTDEKRGRGEDHHAKIMLDLEDTFLGATRQIQLQPPNGRIGLINQTLNVKIPKGVREGQIMRLVGKGCPGNSKPGDLLLKLHFNPHPRFRVDGYNLYIKLQVTPREAALGTLIAVSLFDNVLNVRIPEGTQSGQQLRLRGKGIPSKTQGDLILDILVGLPRANSQNAQEFYELRLPRNSSSYHA